MNSFYLFSLIMLTFSQVCYSMEPKLLQPFAISLSENEANFLTALEEGDIKKVMKFEVDFNKMLRRDGVVALHIAAFKGNLEILEYLLSRELIDKNAMDPHGNTVMHHAIFGNGSDARLKAVITLLLQHGIPYDVKNLRGQTAYDKAVQYSKRAATALFDQHTHESMLAAQAAHDAPLSSCIAPPEAPKLGGVFDYSSK